MEDEYVVDKKVVTEMITNAPTIIATYPIIAKMYKAKYDAFVGEGFTEGQALDIIKSRGLQDF